MSFYKDTHWIGSGPIPHYSFYYLFKDPISKHSHVLRFWGLGLPIHEFRETNSVHVRVLAQMTNSVEGRAWTRGVRVGNFCTYFFYLDPHAEARGVICGLRERYAVPL